MGTLFSQTLLDMQSKPITFLLWSHSDSDTYSVTPQNSLPKKHRKWSLCTVGSWLKINHILQPGPMEQIQSAQQWNGMGPMQLNSF